jgi:hypothetical protein
MGPLAAGGKNKKKAGQRMRNHLNYTLEEKKCRMRGYYAKKSGLNDAFRNEK